MSTMSEASSAALSIPCGICHDLSGELLGPNSRTIVFASVQDLEDGVAHDCRICALILNTALIHASTWTHLAKNTIRITVRTDYARNEYKRELLVRGFNIFGQFKLDDTSFPRNAHPLFTASLYSPLDCPNPIERIPLLPHISSDPLSCTTREMITNWLEHCRNHEECQSTGTRDFPKRLIDVGSGVDATIKLISANKDHKYLALSHCWGAGKPLSATKANEASMRLAIPCDLLPQSFRDAIRTTRWLGERYICIDSLCIVQDDPQDWEEEAAKMAGIFSGCELALASSRASSCSGGFLQPRKESRLVMTGNHQGADLSVFARDPSRHTIAEGGVPHPFHDLPLFKRGWCFQERLLAPRTLHFAFDELFFQCRREERCECGGRSAWSHGKGHSYAYYAATLASSSLHGRAFGSTGQWRHFSMKGPEPDDTATFSQIEGSNSTESPPPNNEVALLRRIYNPIAGGPTDYLEVSISFGQFWSSIVSGYVALNLTFQDDILPALSGIASLMRPYNPGRYIAGLWERDIHYLLGWQSVRDDGKDICICWRPQQYTAPSFSWASRVGPVMFPFQCLMVSVCTVLDIECDVKGVDPYGRVTNGKIVLRGKLILGTISIDDDENSSFLTVCDAQGEEHRGFLEFDTEEEREDIRQAKIDEKVYCFDLFRQSEWEEPGENHREARVHALVLRAVDHSLQTFRRVGAAPFIQPAAFDIASDSTITIL